MTDSANNFAGLNLNNLEEILLTTSYVLKLFCKDFNTRMIQLETADGKLVALGRGFSIIPNLKKLSNLKNETKCKLPFSAEIVDTNLDFQVLSGATVTIKRSSPYLLTAIVEDWNGDILYAGEDSNLSTLLSTIETEFQEQ